MDLDKRPARVAGMFDRIAARYDLLNHVLSGGLDWWWRLCAVRAASIRPGDLVLDVCTGTGDLALAAARSATPPAAVVGIDFAGEMLVRAAAKLARRPPAVPIHLARGDATRLPVGDAGADVVMVAFGIRNVSSPKAAFAEFHRVLRPGGRVVVLEFSLPDRAWLRAGYLAYFRHVLPVVGRIVSRHPDAYRYLPESVSAFATPAQLAAALEEVGFVEVRCGRLTAGTVSLYTGVRR